ncbi:uncharacterized protein LOC143078198 [Mytilus galloprovincialis]|uniref:uncharacterized protein LOC143078198 n=1 Tax=Mytilus galloprovincialis TaxID=29158 RepID=UPI003F7C719D
MKITLRVVILFAGLFPLGYFTCRLYKKIMNCCKRNHEKKRNIKHAEEDELKTKSMRKVVKNRHISPSLEERTPSAKRKNNASNWSNEVMSAKRKNTSSHWTNNIMASMIEESKPKGLINLGNTCFMDAMLQNLAWCPKLQTELEKAHLNKLACKMSNSVLKLLKYTHSEGNNQNFQGYEPADILSAARERNSIFNGYQQQDSFEMFNTIIDAIKEELLELIQKKDSDVYGSDKSDEEQIMRRCTGIRLFFGTFVTEYDYDSCEHVECVFQRFSSMTVPIEISKRKKGSKGTCHQNGNVQQSVLENITDIERGMKYGLMKTEKFGEDIFSCRKCDPPRKDGECKKTMLIFEAPFIMVIHIDRFRENMHGGMDKINDRVTYPETLNIAQFCEAKEDEQFKYNLFGVVAHSGGLNNGHYVAYIKTSQRSSALWYEQMNKSWQDPEKSKVEVERNLELEKLKKKTSELQYKNDDGYKASFIKQDEQITDEAKWYYISDDVVNACEAKEATNNQNAYILMYEKI